MYDCILQYYDMQRGISCLLCYYIHIASLLHQYLVVKLYFY